MEPSELDCATARSVCAAPPEDAGPEGGAVVVPPHALSMSRPAAAKTGMSKRVMGTSQCRPRSSVTGGHTRETSHYSIWFKRSRRKAYSGRRALCQNGLQELAGVAPVGLGDALRRPLGNDHA